VSGFEAGTANGNVSILHECRWLGEEKSATKQNSPIGETYEYDAAASSGVSTPVPAIPTGELPLSESETKPNRCCYQHSRLRRVGSRQQGVARRRREHPAEGGAGDGCDDGEKRELG
jgi:hypothetical protein